MYQANSQASFSEVQCAWNEQVWFGKQPCMHISSGPTRNRSVLAWQWPRLIIPTSEEGLISINVVLH